MSDDIKEISVIEKNQKMVSTNTGDFSMYLDTASFEQAWRVSKLFSESAMVPALYQKQPSNVMIVLEMATRLGVSPMMMMQNCYPIQGKIGMEAKLSIALINSSGIFDGPIGYEVEGTVKDESLKCRVIAKRKNGEEIYGPWVTWDMVKAEGWLAKSGSKWKTMPDLMIRYRAATFFGRLICPERLMGMQTFDEIEDVGPSKEEKGKILEQRFLRDTVIPSESVVIKNVPSDKEQEEIHNKEIEEGRLL